jgi:hypothetical protein
MRTSEAQVGRSDPISGEQRLVSEPRKKFMLYSDVTPDWTVLGQAYRLTWDWIPWSVNVTRRAKSSRVQRADAADRGVSPSLGSGP